MDKTDWGEQFRTLSAAIDAAQQAAGKLGNWLWDNAAAHDVIPERMPEDVHNLLTGIHRSLNEARSSMNDLLRWLVSEPGIKLFESSRLSREEYHLLAVEDNPLIHTLPWSHKDAGLSDYDDYELLDMFFYEDDHWRGYINPAIHPRDKRQIGRARFGICPEDIPASGLREEQRRFFEVCLPDVAARFRREV